MIHDNTTLSEGACYSGFYIIGKQGEALQLMSSLHASCFNAPRGLALLALFLAAALFAAAVYVFQPEGAMPSSKMVAFAVVLLRPAPAFVASGAVQQLPLRQSPRVHESQTWCLHSALPARFSTCFGHIPPGCVWIFS